MSLYCFRKKQCQKRGTNRLLKNTSLGWNRLGRSPEMQRNSCTRQPTRRNHYSSMYNSNYISTVLFMRSQVSNYHNFMKYRFFQCLVLELVLGTYLGGFNGSLIQLLKHVYHCQRFLVPLVTRSFTVLKGEFQLFYFILKLKSTLPAHVPFRFESSLGLFAPGNLCCQFR